MFVALGLLDPEPPPDDAVVGGAVGVNVAVGVGGKAGSQSRCLMPRPVSVKQLISCNLSTVVPRARARLNK